MICIHSTITKDRRLLRPADDLHSRFPSCGLILQEPTCRDLDHRQDGSYGRKTYLA
jgi:hypothetical protein